MRLFVAAGVPDEIRARLSAMSERLQEASLPVRWVRPEGIHLTLKFLGEVPEDRVGRMTELLRGIVFRESLAVEVRGVGLFPDRGRPRVIWAGLEGDVAGIARLAAAVEAALEPAGFQREARPFRAHLTLGRFRQAPRGDWRGMLAPHAQASFGSFCIERFALHESMLGPGGARYRIVSRFPIAGESDR